MGCQEKIPHEIEYFKISSDWFPEEMIKHLKLMNDFIRQKWGGKNYVCFRYNLHLQQVDGYISNLNFSVESTRAFTSWD